MKSCEIQLTYEDYGCLMEIKQTNNFKNISDCFRQLLYQTKNKLKIESMQGIYTHLWESPDIPFGRTCRRVVIRLSEFDIENLEYISEMLGLDLFYNTSEICRMIIRDSYVKLKDCYS